MPHILMTTIKGHRYGNKWYEPGGEFTVPGQHDAILLEKLGRARRVQAIAQAPVRAVVEQAVEAVEERLGLVPAKKRGRPRKAKPVDIDPTQADGEGSEP
jgi:hypothetical protein